MEIYELTVGKDDYTEKFYFVSKSGHLQAYYQKKDGSFEKLNRVGSTWQNVRNVDFVPIHESVLQLIIKKIMEAENKSETHAESRKD